MSSGQKQILVVSIVLFSMGAFFLGCGDDVRTRESYPGTLNNATLTEARHKGGWGRTDCAFCHNLSLNVHRGPDAPVTAESVISEYQSRGRVFCTTCHGSNGVP